MSATGVLIGLATGLLVGASSVGSGSLLTPLLLLLTPVPAGAAIGTSLAVAAGTKLCGYVAHRRMGHIDHRLGTWLIAGALPGSLAAALLLVLLRRTELAAVSARHAVGALLVLLAVALLVAPRWPRLFSRQRQRAASAAPLPGLPRAGAWLIGAGVSLVVTLTSIGSGGLLMLALLLWRPALGEPDSGQPDSGVPDSGEPGDAGDGSAPLCSLVGTATFCGLVTTLLGALAHLALDNIQLSLLAQLALGAAPGVVLGARLTRRIPEAYYQTGIAGLNLLLGLRLAWAG